MPGKWPEKMFTVIHGNEKVRGFEEFEV